MNVKQIRHLEGNKTITKPGALVALVNIMKRLNAVGHLVVHDELTSTPPSKCSPFVHFFWIPEALQNLALIVK